MFQRLIIQIACLLFIGTSLLGQGKTWPHCKNPDGSIAVGAVMVQTGTTPSPWVCAVCDEDSGTYHSVGSGADLGIPCTAPTSVVTDENPDGQVIATHDDGNGTVININETVTTLVDNGDGTYTYTSEDGTVTTLTAGTDVNEIVNNGDGTKTITHTSVDGTVTTWCVPTCNTTIASETGETFELESTCSTQVFDISTNDMPCETRDEDGNLISSGNGIYQLKSISQPNNAQFTPTGDGKVYVTPINCSEPFVTDIETCIVCPDGTTSNVARDVFTFVPPPVGSPRIDKINDAEGNQVETGQTITYTFTILNDPATATGPISNNIVTDRFDLSCFELSSITADTPVGPNNQTPFGTVSLDLAGNLIWDAPGDLLPGESASLDISMTVIKPEGFEYIANIAKVESCILKDDVGNCIEQGSDSAIDVLNEKEYSEARHQWSEPDASGNVTATQEYVKQPSEALIACGEPFRYEHYRDGVLWETITGTLCGNDYVSDRTDGLSITDFSPVGDFGNGLTFGFNLNDWNRAINEATGEKCTNCCDVGGEYIMPVAIRGDVIYDQVSTTEYNVTYPITLADGTIINATYNIEYAHPNVHSPIIPFQNNFNLGWGSIISHEHISVNVDTSAVDCPEIHSVEYFFSDMDYDCTVLTANTFTFVQTGNSNTLGPNQWSGTLPCGGGGNLDGFVLFNIWEEGVEIPLEFTVSQAPERALEAYRFKGIEKICNDPFTSKIYVGGQGSIVCPVESVNTDNDSGSGGPC